MTRSELKKIIADGETVHLECKLAKNAIPANFWETYSSFANTDGGTILLGVKEENHKFSVVGVDDARNAKIFNIFSLVKIGERSGMGLSQLYGNWEEAGYARPQLSESFNPERTKVEIEVEVAENLGKVAENSRQVAEKVAEKQGEVAVKDTEKYTETRSGYTEKVTEKLSETEERIVALILSNAHITQKMLSEAIGLTRQYVGRCMDSLQARKIIRRIGPDKGGYWEVLGIRHS